MENPAHVTGGWYLTDFFKSLSKGCLFSYHYYSRTASRKTEHAGNDCSASNAVPRHETAHLPLLERILPIRSDL